MKVCLYSNYLNAHQIPLAKAFLSINGIDYVFVATTPFDQKRLAMGYNDLNRKYDFVLRAYESKENEKIARDLALNSDIVMVGDSPLDYMMHRLAHNKTTFRACERLFKNGTDLFHFPINIGRSYKHKLFQCQKKPLYFLAMSAYLAYDVNLFTEYPGRTFKWGYFIKNNILEYNALKRERERSPKKKILWIGRLLKWKHPDAVIRLAAKLKESNYSFECKIFGDGEMKQVLLDMIKKENLEECVQFKGFIAQEEVRSEMEHSDIFLFTSDHNEGWGAVLNEAMSSGCAVVSSHASGATPFLINDGINGYSYQYGNEGDLLRKTESLLNDGDLSNSFGKHAFDDMRSLWDASTAAHRLIKLAEAIETGNDPCLFTSGPCSPAR